MKTQRARRLLPQAISACTLATTAAIVFTPSAMASPYTGYGTQRPRGALATRQTTTTTPSMTQSGTAEQSRSSSSARTGPT